MAAVSLQVWDQVSSLFHLQRGSAAQQTASRSGSHLHGLQRWGSAQLPVPCRGDGNLFSDCKVL